MSDLVGNWHHNPYEPSNLNIFRGNNLQLSWQYKFDLIVFLVVCDILIKPTRVFVVVVFVFVYFVVIVFVFIVVVIRLIISSVASFPGHV